MEDVTISVNI